MMRNTTKRSRDQQRQEVSRRLMLIFMAIFFIGLALQITMMARLARQNKQRQRLEAEIRDWSARADNLELALNQYKSLDRVAAQAEKLGMEKPTEGQIRVVSVPEIVEATSAQSAGDGAGES